MSILSEQSELPERIVKMLGSDQILVKCTGATSRLNPIRGKLTRRIRVRDGDIILMDPWESKSDERRDVL